MRRLQNKSASRAPRPTRNTLQRRLQSELSERRKPKSSVRWKKRLHERRGRFVKGKSVPRPRSAKRSEQQEKPSGRKSVRKSARRKKRRKKNESAIATAVETVVEIDQETEIGTVIGVAAVKEIAQEIGDEEATAKTVEADQKRSRSNYPRRNFLGWKKRHWQISYVIATACLRNSPKWRLTKL